MTHRIPVRSAALAALAVAVSFAAPAAGLRDVPVAAADDRPSALPRFLEALQIGPGTELRLAVVHPILVAPPAGDPVVPDLAASAPPDMLGAPVTSRDRRDVVRAANLGPKPVWVLPGDVWRLDDGDFVTQDDAVLPAGGTADVAAARVAGVLRPEKPREEPRLAGWLPGPALLWTLLSTPRDAVVEKACADFADEATLKTPRRSPLDLAGADVLRKRVDEYRVRFATLAKPPAAGRREITGFAAVLDGGFACVEVFADPRRFRDAWPRRVEGLAVEAAILELENGVLDEAVPPGADPDRYTTVVKDALLELYGLTPKPRRVEGLGAALDLKKDRDIGRVVTDPTGAPQHLLWLRDPSNRRTDAPTTPEETPPLDPGVLDRKRRLTEFERRWLERRKAREPQPGK